MDLYLFIGLCVSCAFLLGVNFPREVSRHKAASIIGKLGRQTQLRTQAEKTRAIHDQLRDSIGSSQDHARSAGDAAPRGRPA